MSTKTKTKKQISINAKSTFVVALLAMGTITTVVSVTQSPAQAAQTKTYYGCVGETRGGCERKFPQLKDSEYFFKDCGWHGDQYPNSTTQAFARDICKLSDGSAVHRANRLKTKPGGACGYGMEKIECDF